RATAPGYLARRVSVVFSANVTLDLSLERIQPDRVATLTPPPAPARTSSALPPPARPAHVIAPAMRTNETASARPRDEFKLDQTTDAQGGVLPTGKAPRNPESPNPRCDSVAQSPVIARIIAINVQGSEAIIAIAAGAGSGVQNHWSATVLRGDTDEPLAGG